MLTEKQLLIVFNQWHCTEKPPRKGMAVYVCFPLGTYRMCKVTLSEHKSTYGQKLYQLDFS